MKICGNCKSSIDDGASICPHCRTEQGGLACFTFIASLAIVGIAIYTFISIM